MTSAGPIEIKTALLSVSDKAGLEDLCRSLAARGVELISTGGTAEAIRKAGLIAKDVSDVTGLPELMDGRVKTLHPKIHGGLLGDFANGKHEEEALAQGIAPIDLVVVNLYPFEDAVASDAVPQTCVETIDVGGPAMIRAGAKNHARVSVIVDPADYAALLAELDAQNGATTFEFRRRLAAKAFARTAAYDAAIATWFADLAGETAPHWRSFSGALAQRLRYGENPHQAAAFYRTASTRAGVATSVQHQGKELSYNNIADTDAAFELVAEFGTAWPAVAIVKHGNPCGAAVAQSVAAAYRLALASDPVSAFGGVVAVNTVLDEAGARAITDMFTEVVIAPEVTPQVKAIFAAKPNLRLLTTGGLPDAKAPGLEVRSVSGGLLVQDRDNARAEQSDMRVVSRRKPTDWEWRNLRFAFAVAKHVKSNAIVYAKNGATVGIGAGQMSRIDASTFAALKGAEVAAARGDAEPATRGSVVASDAFFPFPDALIAVADAGATALIQPGGSMRDDEVIAAANERDMAMVFTGIRHFRH